MKNKRFKFVINLILIMVVIIMAFSTNVQASGNNIDGWISQGNAFIEAGEKAEQPLNTTQIRDIVIPIAQALVAIATVVLAVLAVIWGIKYMTCQSPDQRAKLKTQLIGFVVSAVVIFGAQVIWSTLYNFMSKVTS